MLATQVLLSKIVLRLAIVLAGFGGILAIAPSEVRAADPTTPITCEQSRTTGVNAPLKVPTVIDASCAVVPLGFMGEIAQPSFDLTAWLTFLAVNWPADPLTCSADPNVSILKDPSQPTWLSYASDTTVFVPPGQVPAPWCAQGSGLAGMEAAARTQAVDAQRLARVARLPEKVRALAEAHPEVTLFLSHNAKGAGFLHGGAVAAEGSLVPIDGITQATGQPVVDQNGRFVRYGVYMNRQEYDYLVPNKLWTKAGQQAAPSILFPASNRATGTPGSMELKAAWKVLGPADDPSRFLTRQAIVYNDDGDAPSPGANPVTVGLAGLHLIQKTYNATEWIWATFEQVDNDTKSFFNPGCTDCPANVPPNKPYLELNTSTGAPLNKPTQVVSVLPKNNDPEVAGFNTQFQVLLAGTPWANYRLVSAQWLGEFGNTPKPPQLGNSIIETFVKPGPATYGCLQCHSKAAAYPSGKASDRSFIIYAQQ